MVEIETYTVNKSLALLIKLQANSYSPTALSIKPILICKRSKITYDHYYSDADHAVNFYEGDVK